MEGEKKRGRPRMMLLDRMLEEDYRKLKEKAGEVAVNGAIARTNLPRNAEDK